MHIVILINELRYIQLAFYPTSIELFFFYFNTNIDYYIIIDEVLLEQPFVSDTFRLEYN